MINKKSRKDIRKIQKEVKRLKEKFKKLEIRPCQGDADLKQKEEALKMLKLEFYELNKMANQFSLLSKSGASINVQS